MGREDASPMTPSKMNASARTNRTAAPARSRAIASDAAAPRVGNPPRADGCTRRNAGKWGDLEMGVDRELSLCCMARICRNCC